jgi:sarcosine oxidase delta subunit
MRDNIRGTVATAYVHYEGCNFLVRPLKTKLDYALGKNEDTP